LAVKVLAAQVESVEPASERFVWVSHGRVEGHLALEYSPSGAFSPDSALLAVASQDKIVLMDVREAGVHKILRPQIAGVSDLDVQSANFLAMNQLFVLASGVVRPKGKQGGAPTPLLGFQWNAVEDRLSGKVNSIGAGEGFGRARYFPEIGYLAIYKNNGFSIWNPRDNQAGQISIPALTQQSHLYAFAPDGHWMLLGRIEMSSSADPVVVEMGPNKFVDTLRGHQGTLLSMAFSRDSKRVVTACEDGKVRVFAVPSWQLLHTLAGHHGPVLWAEFSPEGARIVSGGQDKTVRVWSVEDGTLEQTLQESQAPIRTVAFSPNGEYVAASGDEAVYVWQRTRAR
jgi:hypothetical protein